MINEKDQYSSTMKEYMHFLLRLALIDRLTDHIFLICDAHMFVLYYLYVILVSLRKYNYLKYIR